MPLVTAIDEVSTLVGQPLGHSEWHEITQHQVDLFAEATWDHPWIHVDPERAASGPYGGTIAHGFLTIALTPTLLAEVWRVDGVDMVVNRGLNNVLMRSPVPVGAKVRMVATLISARSRPRSFTEVVVGLTFEADHGGAIAKACTAEQTILLRAVGV
jgi:acyl dehydratase